LRRIQKLEFAAKSLPPTGNCAAGVALRAAAGDS
jgi:hypothetical protein